MAKHPQFQDLFPQMMQPQASAHLMFQMFYPTLSAQAAWIDYNARVLHMASEGTRQWFDFLARRLEKDAELINQLQSADNPSQFVKLCSEFASTTASDYQDEMRELSRIPQELAQTAANAAGQANTRTTRDPYPGMTGGGMSGDGRNAA